MAGVIIFCGLLFCRVALVFGQTATDAKNLRTDIFGGYDKKIRPIVNQSQAVVVNVSLFLLAINGLDEVTEVLKTTGYLWITWQDHFLTWDPNAYGGLEHYFWPQVRKVDIVGEITMTCMLLLADKGLAPLDDIWKPDVALKNSFKEYKDLGVSSLNVQIQSDGIVTWYPFQVFESTCTMHIDYFPFDVQTCTLTFVAWSYGQAEVNILNEDDGLFLSEYQPNSAWDIVGTSWRSEVSLDEAAIHFSIRMMRKPLYVVLSVILPIAFLAVLNIFVFVLPCESGERSGYAVTVFLALAVFLTIVSETLPANSDTVALLSIYLIIQTAQSTMITLIALIMLRINFLTGETKVPACVIVMLKLSERLRCRSKKLSNKVTDVVKQEKQPDDNLAELVSITEASSEDKKHCGGTAVSLAIDDQESRYTCKHVINLLDVVCLVFFSAVCVISTVVCFGMSMMVDQ